MRKIIKIGIGIAVVMVVVAGTLSYYNNKQYEESFTSEYNYRITLGTDSTLKNLTLYIPLPIFRDGSKIGDEIIAGNASKPSNWNLSIVNTEHGKMLKIIANEFIPEYHSLPVAIHPGEETAELPEQKTSDTYSQDTPVLSSSKEITVTLRADHKINTTNPAENEPLLSPKYNLTLSSYNMPYPEGRTPPVVYKYESRINADYAASPGANLSVIISLKGMNSWWVYDWSFKEYSDRIDATITGEQHGWSNAAGNLEFGR